MLSQASNTDRSYAFGGVDPSVAQAPLPLQLFLPGCLPPPWPLQSFLPLQECFAGAGVSCASMTPAAEAEGEVGCAFRRTAVPPSKPATAAARAMFFTLLFVMGRKTFLYRLRPHAFVCDGRLWTEANLLTKRVGKR